MFTNALMTAALHPLDSAGVDIGGWLDADGRAMLAHSLGNMLTCEAIARHGLQYSKYYMLNAVVPIEAFDAGADAETNMQPLSWQRYSDVLL